jgi:hypothetical protein
MPKPQIEIPRYFAMQVNGHARGKDNFLCVCIPNDGDAPNEKAVAMFTRKDDARRFIEMHELTDCAPAFAGNRELRTWLTECAKNRARWAVINFRNEARFEMVKSFRITDAIAAINSAAVESEEPILVEAHTLML